MGDATDYKEGMGMYSYALGMYSDALGMYSYALGLMRRLLRRGVATLRAWVLQRFAMY